MHSYGLIVMLTSCDIHGCNVKNIGQKYRYLKHRSPQKFDKFPFVDKYRYFMKEKQATEVESTCYFLNISPQQKEKIKK